MDEKENIRGYQGNAGHRGRLRKRFLENGLDSLNDYERLELLLMFAIPRRDVKPIAKDLIEKFKNLSGVIDASVKELEEVEGMGENSITIFKLIKSLVIQYLGEEMERYEVSLSDIDRVIDFANARIGPNEEESMMVIYLNIKNMVIDHEITSGTVDQAMVYPRKIMESAIRHKATGLILVHNHPSGDCKPSAADEKLTAKLSDLVNTMNIKVIDHLIVCKDDSYSFARAGKL